MPWPAVCQVCGGRRRYRRRLRRRASTGATSPARLDKLDEETAELRQAVRDGANVEEELGDVLFAAVKVGRFCGVDPETSVNGTCEKFIRRFRAMEEAAAAAGAACPT